MKWNITTIIITTIAISLLLFKRKKRLHSFNVYISVQWSVFVCRKCEEINILTPYPFSLFIVIVGNYDGTMSIDIGWVETVYRK